MVEAAFYSTIGKPPYPSNEMMRAALTAALVQMEGKE
jgi:hypothetical protein